MKAAFTLAETLLTLAIIGVIAALTIPTIQDHSDEVKYVAATKKAYAGVTAAAMAVETRHSDMIFWDFSSTKTVDWFKEVVNTVPNTGKSEWEHVHLDGSCGGFNCKITPSFISADGMAWMIGGGKGSGYVIIDTNGELPPNVTGIDQHKFRVGKSTNGVDAGVYPDGTPGHDNDGSWCTYKVIKEDKMPWLRDFGKANSCQGYK